MLATVKLDANIDAVILRQSEQLQTKVWTNPGPWVGWWQSNMLEYSVERKEKEKTSGQGPRHPSRGTEWIGELTNASCTALQKHVAVASSSLDQPSSVDPARGM